MAHFTRKLALGLCAGVLFLSTAVAQSAREQNAFQTRSFDRPVVEAGENVFQAPVRPGTQRAPIDSSIYYEDFRDGLAGWTFIKTAPDSFQVWEYEKNPNLAAENGDSRMPVFTSPTAANGFLFLDYQKFTKRLGLNTAPPSEKPYYIMKQTAISPMFSMKAAVPGQVYTLNWYGFDPRLSAINSYVEMRFMGKPTSAVKIYEVPDDVARPNVARQRDVFARIPAKFVGRDSVEIRFVYDANFYGWAIDDIYIGGLPSNEVSLNKDFIAVAPNYSTPQSQVAGQNIYFVTDLQNNGGATQSPRVVVEIYKLTASGGTLYYADSLDYPSIPADSVLDNNVFEKFVPMPTEAGQYRVFYDVYTRDAADADADSGNNSASYDFFVRAADSLVSYAKAGAFRNGTTPADAAAKKDFELGNIYYTPNLGSKGARIDSIEYGFYAQGFGDTNDAANYEVRTYGFKGDLNNDGIVDYGDDVPSANAELVLLGTRFFQIAPKTKDDFYEYVVAPAEDEQTLQPKRLLLPANQGYIGYAIGISYTEASSRGLIEDDFFVGTDTQFPTGASSLVRDSLTRRGLRPVSGEYSDFSNLRGLTGTGAKSGYDAFGSNALYLNTLVTFLDSVNLSSVRTELVAKEFALSPNPASTELNVAFDFGDNARNVTFTVTNGVGQQVMHLNQPIAASGRITIPVQSLNQGVYFVTAIAENGARATRRVLIQR